MKLRLEIDTEGVIKGKKRKARKEIRSLFREVVRKETPIKVIVTKDFKATVNHYLQEKRKVKIRYDPKRSKGQAIAKALPYISNDKLHFALIIDSAIFGDWKTEERIFRTFTLSHEVVHIKDYILRFEEMGTKAFDEPKTLQQVMFELADDIWAEYHAERIILDISKELASERKEITFDPTRSLNRIKDFKEMVKEIVPFLQSEIEDFRKWHSTIDDLWGTAYLRIREMLVLATYVAAISDTTKDFKAEIEGVKVLTEYRFIFQGVWDKIQNELRSAYKKKGKFPKTELENIASNLKTIFHRCGFELKDVKKRLWVEPHEIDL